MKKAMSFIVMFLICFILADCSGSCIHDEVSNEIAGTWSNYNVQIIFNGSVSWTRKINGENHSKGYYEIDEKDKTLQIVISYYWVDDAWVYQSEKITADLEYEWNDNTLILKNNDNEKEIPLNGIYTSPDFNGTVIRFNIGC